VCYEACGHARSFGLVLAVCVSFAGYLAVWHAAAALRHRHWWQAEESQQTEAAAIGGDDGRCDRVAS